MEWNVPLQGKRTLLCASAAMRLARRVISSGAGRVKVRRRIRSAVTAFEDQMREDVDLASMGVGDDEEGLGVEGGRFPLGKIQGVNCIGNLDEGRLQGYELSDQSILAPGFSSLSEVLADFRIVNSSE